MATYGKWITVEDGCELPNEWEGVIVAAQTRTKIEKAIYTAMFENNKSECADA